MDSEGVLSPITVGGNVAFTAGANTSVEVDDDTIIINAGSSLGEENPDARQKYIDIIEGNAPFSGVPYWMSTINRSGTDDGAFFFGVDACYHFGQFLDAIGDFTNAPELLPNMLSIMDTCPACTDCANYDDLQTHMTTVKDAIDERKDDIKNPKELLDQYQSLIERWNYVVQLKSWRYNAEATGAEIHASCKYTNHTDAAIPAGLVMSIDFQGAPVPSRAYVIDTAVKGTITRGDLTTYTGHDGGGAPGESPSSEDDTAVYLETTAALTAGDGIRFYAGSLSPKYIGDDTRVTVNFGLTVPSGGIGDHDTNFSTNKMVVVEGWE